MLFPELGYWRVVRDGDPRASALYRRHYSCYTYRDGRRHNPSNRHRHLIMGPGQKLLLLGGDCLALFGWRKFIDRSGQEGINCAIFRNESPYLSSQLILEAETLALSAWSDVERFYTYVNPKAIASKNPGYCFKMAGWRTCGVTAVRKLLILEKLLCNT